MKLALLLRLGQKQAQNRSHCPPRGTASYSARIMGAGSDCCSSKIQSKPAMNLPF